MIRKIVWSVESSALTDIVIFRSEFSNRDRIIWGAASQKIHATWLAMAFIEWLFQISSVPFS